MEKARLVPTVRGSIAFVVVIVLLLGATWAWSQDERQSATRASMRGIFNAITTALEYSLDPDVFADAANHDNIQRALTTLAANAAELEGHGGGLDVSFDYMRRSLAEDAREAVKRFDSGNYVGSRFVLRMMTENCVTCHTRLPQAQRFDLGGRFLDDIDLERLSPVALANLRVTTRQFDDALGTWEGIFDAPEMTPATLDLYRAFESYLRICIGAKNDTRRAIQTFERFNERGDMPASMKELVATWIRSLKQLDLDEAEGKELPVARVLIGDARYEMEYTRDRPRLVEYVAATSLLHRYLNSDPAQDIDVAEAYYLLAVAESKVSHSYWVSETEFLLGQAIRQAPKSPVAREAYDFLESYTHSAYRQSLARPVPPEVATNLDELWDLIER